MSEVGTKISGSGADAAGEKQDGKYGIVKLVDEPQKKVKHQSPQEAIDEFWEKFDSKTPGRGKSCHSLISRIC